jgi:DNA-binding transcriptional LysR family regulator
MNWAAINFDWNQARAFLAAVEAGSFSKAAQATGQSQPTISRQVAALEADLGVTLFERSTRTLAPTQAGHALITHVRAMADAATAARLAAAGQSEDVEGLVTITATEMYAPRRLAPVAARIRRQNPGLQLELIASSALKDLKRREADIAIRHARPTQSDLIARLLEETPAYLCASPAYLSERGRPESLSALERHDFIGFDTPERTVEGLAARGLTLNPASIKMFSNDGDVITALCHAGAGLMVNGADLIEQEGFVPVLTDQFRLSIPTWLVAHREVNTSARIRLVFDALADGLSAQRKRAAPEGTARIKSWP